MKNVMTKAWEIAKEGQKKFGGKVKEYFAEALKMAWALIKKGVNKMNNLPKVVEMRAKELFETGYQPTMQYAINKAKHEYNTLINNIKKIKGEQVDLTPYNQALNNCTLDRYKEIVMQFGFYASQK